MKLLSSVAALAAASAHSDHDHGKKGKWSAMSPLPNGGLSDMTATTIEAKGTVLISGGCNQDQIACNWWENNDDHCTFCPSVSKETYFYDVSKDSWRRGLDLPRPRYRHAAVATPDGNVYLVGGRDANDDIIPEVDLFDATTSKWSTTAFKVYRSDLGAVYKRGSLLIVGGYDQDYNAQKESIDIEILTGTVTKGAVLNEARGDLGLVVTGVAQAFAVGGWSDADWCNPLKTVERLDLNSQWPDFAMAPPLKVGRGDKAVVGTRNHVYVVGGEHNNQCDSGSSPVDDVEVYGTHPNGDEWEVIGDIPEEKFRGAAAAFGDGIFMFGGQGTRSTSCADDVAFCFPVTDHVWRMDVEAWENDDYEPSGKKSKKSKKDLSRTDEIVIVIVAVVVGVCALIALLFVCKKCCCKKSENPGSWQDPPASMEMGKTPRGSDPPPGHWKP